MGNVVQVTWNKKIIFPSSGLLYSNPVHLPLVVCITFSTRLCEALPLSSPISNERHVLLSLPHLVISLFSYCGRLFHVRLWLHILFLPFYFNVYFNVKVLRYFSPLSAYDFILAVNSITGKVLITTTLSLHICIPSLAALLQRTIRSK